MSPALSPPAGADAAALQPDVAYRPHVQPPVDDALGQQLRRCVQQRAETADQPLLQRKTDEERAVKNRRVARARATIKELGTNLKDTLDRHLFAAQPIVGALNKAAPCGLHAYTAGALPAGITGVVTGNADKVHTLTWHWNTNPGATKDSTMFPRWMPETHVRTLIGLSYPGDRKTAVADGKLAPTDARTYITRGTRVALNRAGDTVYPEL
jgi:hypothetical protein